jgi:DNA repair exonuclease SbcCD ATPase subunit
MKPDWDSLMEEYKGHESKLIADVDCTTAGKALCDKAGVRGYPTIKHGDPNNLEDYKGGRDLAALKKFAEGLKPMCSPAKLDLCDDDMKAKIVELQKLSAADLDKQIKEKEDEMAAAEKKFTDEVDALQKRYQELQTEKEDAIQAVKDAGLGLMKSVKAAAGKAEL